jgi:predicted Zn-dependent peptidase
LREYLNRLVGLFKYQWNTTESFSGEKRIVSQELLNLSADIACLEDLNAKLYSTFKISDSIKTIRHEKTPNGILKFMRRLATTDNAVLVIVGNIPSNITQLLTQFSKVKKSIATRQKIITHEPLKRNSWLSTVNKTLNKYRVVIHYDITANNPVIDTAFDIFSFMLCSDRLSPLFYKLRIELGQVYGVRAEHMLCEDSRYGVNYFRIIFDMSSRPNSVIETTLKIIERTLEKGFDNDYYVGAGKSYLRKMELSKISQTPAHKANMVFDTVFKCDKVWVPSRYDRLQKVLLGDQQKLLGMVKESLGNKHCVFISGPKKILP